MPRIAFVTYRQVPQLTADDSMMSGWLRDRGIDLQAVPWDAEGIRWNEFDLVVLRSCWDYHLHIKEFRAWLDSLVAANVRVLNPPDLVRWNMEKTYLLQLENRGVTIAPSVWFPKHSRIDLAAVLLEHSWHKAVMKPTISATAYKTAIVTPSTAVANQPALDDLAAHSGVIIQEFMDEVVDHGELSLLFFDKNFSHVVVKKAKAGDFRVQDSFGGTQELIKTPLHLVPQAQDILNGIESEIAYARVDCIDRNGKLILMELEVIEPLIYLIEYPPAVEAFGNALMARLK